MCTPCKGVIRVNSKGLNGRFYLQVEHYWFWQQSHRVKQQEKRLRILNEPLYYKLILRHYAKKCFFFNGQTKETMVLFLSTPGGILTKALPHELVWVL